LIVDIEIIGERQMTQTTKPFALIFAAAAFLSLWLPTLAVPAQAQTHTASITLPILA
jgi:hypothetical protein